MKAPAVKPFRPVAVPRFGVIVGGLLDGWNYTFIRVVVADGQAQIEVIAQPPHWPFTSRSPIRLKPSDFETLEADPRSGSTDTRTHIAAALAAEKSKYAQS